MELMTAWGILGIIAYFAMSIKDFLSSDWGIKKEYLSAKNREKWQKNKAILELAIACFGTITMLSQSVFQNNLIFLISGFVVLLLFFLTIFNEDLLKD